MEKIKHEILLTQTGLTFQIPLFLSSTVDEMGVMVGFDGNISQVEEFCNFTYTQTGNTLQIYNTVFVEKFKNIKDASFTIDWGDGTSSNLPIHVGSSLESIIKTYTNVGEYTVTISLLSPWTKQKLSKLIKIPEDILIQNPLGTYSGFTIPYTTLTGSSQNYLNDYDYNTYTAHTNFTYVSIGGSRIFEKKLYGSNVYTGVTSGITEDNLSYLEYTIDNLVYRDYSDGYTMITGSTSGFTKEEVINYVITRNEHFIGFIEEPIIYSDVFVERGKAGVMEYNLRLGEIDNVGELEIYGNGFFRVKKQ